MNQDPITSMTMDTNERQRKYVEFQKARGTNVGIVFADAFLRGIRDLGYKNPAWSLAEMVDNAIQATATEAGVFFGFKPDNVSQAKPDEPPNWILGSKNGLNISALESGTVIVLEDLDRLRRLQGWITTKSLEQKLLQLLGTIYRHWIPSRKISVNGNDVQSVDPLFL